MKKVYVIENEGELVEVFLSKLDAHDWAAENICNDCFPSVSIKAYYLSEYSEYIK